MAYFFYGRLRSCHYQHTIFFYGREFLLCFSYSCAEVTHGEIQGGQNESMNGQNVAFKFVSPTFKFVSLCFLYVSSHFSIRLIDILRIKFLTVEIKVFQPSEKR